VFHNTKAVLYGILYLKKLKLSLLLFHLFHFHQVWHAFSTDLTVLPSHPAFIR